ncbi:hypothetical protein CLV62_12634 [Dysgonomonas alginatilytica]|uniref:GIY-YIG domain-containing protein n=1 Tax=Dysgonomonas alginatilytica TaxID=1605892 RepID=A0A2V3PJR3_9BACT|nr:hypothetical protein [Dysgonomonas alginatilytica]PXV61100.1 hypothetical protein CLV62_12634 [Dysgonomonas alginatilytica]
MTALSISDLNNLNPEKIYNIKTFVLNLSSWLNIRNDLNVILQNPIKVRFDSNIQAHLSSRKGIYMFFVEPNFPFTPEARYLMYVGRVISDNTFKKRFYDYVNAIGNRNKRRNIQLLTNLWPNKTWVYYYELDHLSDDEITAIEDNLIDNVIPPMNNKFKIKEAVNSRSIYN